MKLFNKFKEVIDETGDFYKELKEMRFQASKLHIPYMPAVLTYEVETDDVIVRAPARTLLKNYYVWLNSIYGLLGDNRQYNTTDQTSNDYCIIKGRNIIYSGSITFPNNANAVLMGSASFNTSVRFSNSTAKKNFYADPIQEIDIHGYMGRYFYFNSENIVFGDGLKENYPEDFYAYKLGNSILNKGKIEEAGGGENNGWILLDSNHSTRFSYDEEDNKYKANLFVQYKNECEEYKDTGVYISEIGLYTITPFLLRGVPYQSMEDNFVRRIADQSIVPYYLLERTLLTNSVYVSLYGKIKVTYNFEYEYPVVNVPTP